MQRILWLDVMRGILLFLITIGHFEPEGTMIYPILSPTAMYYVPLFFFISGYMTNPRKYGFVEFLKKRIKSLLIPYVFFVILFTICDWNILKDPLGLISHNMHQLIVGHSVIKATPIWFISCLFVVSIFHYLSIRLLKFKTIYILFFIICLSVISLHYSNSGIVLPWHLDKLAMILVFSMSGYLANLLIKNNRVNKSIYTFLGFLGFLGMFVDLGDLHYNQINMYPLFYIMPISFAISIVYFLSFYPVLTEHRIGHAFAWISRNGLVILAFHSYIGFIYSILANKLSIKPLFWGADFYMFFKVIFVYSALFIFVVPFMNRFCYMLIGKSRIEWKENYKK